MRRITRPGDAITTDRALALQPTIPQIRRNSTTVRTPCFFALRIIAFNVTSPTGVRSPSKTARKRVRLTWLRLGCLTPLIADKHDYVMPASNLTSRTMVERSTPGT